jgi:hypothetical protein
MPGQHVQYLSTLNLIFFSALCFLSQQLQPNEERTLMPVTCKQLLDAVANKTSSELIVNNTILTTV